MSDDIKCSCPRAGQGFAGICGEEQTLAPSGCAVACPCSCHSATIKDPFEAIALKHNTIRRLDAMKLELMDALEKIKDLKFKLQTAAEVSSKLKDKIRGLTHRIQVSDAAQRAAENQRDTYKRLWERMTSGRK